MRRVHHGGFGAGHRGLLGALLVLGACSCAPVRSGGEGTRSAHPDGTAATVLAAEVLQPDVPLWIDAPPAPEAAGVGTLEVKGSGDLTAQLDLRALEITVTPAGTMALFEVEHRFHNPTDEQLEGTFRFPLPDASVVTGLAMEIEQRMMEGEIVDREKAREIYQSIVDQMQDPAILEWEQGSTFKLRVFPIEPHADKRVVIRYLAPISRVRDGDGEHWEIVVPTAAPAMQGEIGRLVVRMGDETVVDRTHARPQGAVHVPLPAGYAPPEIAVDADARGRFTEVRLRPDWSAIPKPPVATGGRRLTIVVDTSRSALEGWALARASVANVLDSLEPTDQFCVIASDLRARALSSGFVSATPEATAEVLAALEAIAPDGASDLGAAFTAVGERLAEDSGARVDQVLYIGDGNPTWGETEPRALIEHAAGTLGAAPLHAMVLGKATKSTLLQRIAGASGGRVATPDAAADVAWFTDFLALAPTLRRLRGVQVEVEGDAEIALPAATTIYEGQTPSVLFRTAPGAEPPSALTLRAHGPDGPIAQTIALGDAKTTAHVRRRWASRRIEELQVEAEHRAEVVALSQEHGVLSRFTALLVLESEEAYREHEIERRQQAERDAASPQVTGRDLEGGDASLSPGDIQPGDPEILIPAPEDARSVVVVFPFGETKTARWDARSGQWIVRFLIDEETAPGTYEVAVRVTLADGSVQMLTAEYTVDTRAPQLDLSLRAMDDGSFELRATQRVEAADRVREHPEGMAVELPEAHDPGDLDARHLQAHMPDGQILRMVAGLPGVFVVRWVPRTPVRGPVEVEVTASDRALNTARIVQTLEAEAL